MKIKTYKIQMPGIASPHFVYGTFDQLQSFLDRKGYSDDIARFQDAHGGSVKEIVWVSSMFEMDSLDFVTTLIHESSHFVDQAIAGCRASYKAHVISMILSQVLDKYDLDGRIAQNVTPDLRSLASTGKSPLKVPIEIYGYEISFMYSSYAQMAKHAKSALPGQDLSEYKVHSGIALGGLIWINTSIQHDPAKFLSELVLQAACVTEATCEDRGLTCTESKAYLVEFTVKKILTAKVVDQSRAA